MATASKKLNIDYHMVADYLWERTAFMTDASRRLRDVVDKLNCNELDSRSEEWFLDIQANIHHFLALEKVLREEAILARDIGRSRQISGSRKSN